ncbi:MAG: RNA polymerase sigma factor [Patescibacteria group bacterium]
MSNLFPKFFLLKLKTKDPEVFGQFYDLYVSKIYRFIFYKVSSAEEAEDLTSEVFLKIWQHLADNKKIDHLNAFVYQVARNLVVDHYRQKSQQKIVREDDNQEMLEQIPDHRLAVDQQLDLQADAEVLEKAIRKLKDEYREIIILRYLDGLSTGEVARVTNKTKGNVRVLAYRAIKALKDIIESSKPLSDE